ncbi:MAG: RimK family alpha-L-glutamate ligase [Gemmataceae bacterium]|nr:RimK family alpha-L-glutamate ligase [Gemmataceae bacterium]
MTKIAAKSLRIGVLSCGAGWHVRDLIRAAGELGHVAEAVDFRQVYAAVPHGTSLDGYDAVVVRTMPPGSLEQVIFRMDVLHQLERRGRLVLNPPRALEICVDKYLASARLEAAGLPTPPTVVCQGAEAAFAAYERLGGDVVVKPLFGSEGRGMMRVQTPDMAWRVFRTLERLQAVLYLQRFVSHPGWDLRIFVLAGQVVAAMRRVAGRDWRTNIAQGGRATAHAPTPEETTLALAAAGAVGAVAAGVDLLPRPEGGYYVLEVNAVPGWRALAPATKTDVARALLGHVQAACLCPPGGEECPPLADAAAPWTDSATSGRTPPAAPS